MGMIGFDVRTSLRAVEDVVCRVMDELCVDLAAGHGDVANGECIGLEGGERFPLSDVDLVVSGGVDHHLRVRFGERLFDTMCIRNIERLPVEWLNSPSAAPKFAAQFDTELAATAKDHDLLLHLFAEYRSTGE